VVPFAISRRLIVPCSPGVENPAIHVECPFPVAEVVERYHGVEKGPRCGRMVEANKELLHEAGGCLLPMFCCEFDWWPRMPIRGWRIQSASARRLFRMVRRGVAFMRSWSLKPGCEMCPKLGNLSAVDNEAGLSRDPRPRPAFKWIVRGIN
jgi:hypothetical protein